MAIDKLFATNLIALNIISLNVLPVRAQGMFVETKEYVNAISSVEIQLTTDRQLMLEQFEINDRNAPGTSPEGRPHQYAFGISGSATETVMSSNVLMSTLATQIIDNCNSISSVSFGEWGTGLFWVYGLVPNGEVEFFKCREDHFHGGGYRDLVWGKSCPV